MHRAYSLPLILFPVVLLGLSGCVRTPAAQVLGRLPASAPTVQIGRLTASPRSVTVRGTMIEKCPVAGCWFKLRDASGVLKVTTKNAGFVVLDVPDGTLMTVSGILHAQPERELAATGLRY